MPLRSHALGGLDASGVNDRAGDATALIERGLARLNAQADAAAVAHVRALDVDISLEACRQALAASATEAADDDARARIYDAAEREFAASRLDACVALLATLMFDSQAGPDSLIGLAICALRLDRFAQADALSAECIRKGMKHPRLFCVAGVCRLQAGSKSEAMDLLALASRLARRNLEFRDDLRVAQTLLITLHYYD